MRKRDSESIFTGIDEEFRNRSGNKVEDVQTRLANRATPKQTEFLADPASHIALCCGRRATKTYGLGLKLAQLAATRAYAVCVYLTERKERARELMWDSPDTGLKKLNEDLDLGLRFNNTYLEALMPLTKSIIKVRGAETRADVDKLRGEPADIFVLDEVRNWTNTKLLDHLVDNVLEPQTADHRGQIVLASNPGEVMAGTFYDATRPGSTLGRPYAEREAWGERPWLWSVHRWTAQDNTALPHIWQEFLRIKERRGWSDQNPTWRREYLGEWVSDGSNLVFRFEPDRNTYDPDPKTRWGLPEGHAWKFLCGMDFGVADDFALVVAATAETHPVMYEVFAFSKPGMVASEIMEVFRMAQAKFGAFEAVVGDVGGIGKGYAEELSRPPHNLNLEAADKQKKLVFTELLNSDMVEGRIKVRRASPLRDEMLHLQWADPNTKHKTVRGQKDHCSDAFLYLWRRSSHNETIEVVNAPVYGTPEWAKAMAERDRQRAMVPRDTELDGACAAERFLDTYGKGLLS